MILIVGGTGDLGSRVTDRLLAKGEDVRLLSRPGPGQDSRTQRDAEHVFGDLKDAASLVAACAGVDTVVTTANAAARSAPDTVESVDLAGNLNLIEAAEAAGVERFVFVSALGADPQNPMPLLRAKGTAEQRLRTSPMAWTVLQPNVFMDKLIPIVVGASALSNRPVTLIGSGRRRHSFVAMRDVADYVVETLDQAQAHRQVIPVAGPQPLSWGDVVAAFEAELGRSVPIHSLLPGADSPDLPEFVIQLLTALDAYDSDIDMARTSRAFGVKPTYLAEFVHGFVDTARHQAVG